MTPDLDAIEGRDPVEVVREALRLEGAGDAHDIHYEFPDGTGRCTTCVAVTAANAALEQLTKERENADDWRMAEARALAELQTVGLERNALAADLSALREQLAEAEEERARLYEWQTGAIALFDRSFEMQVEVRDDIEALGDRAVAGIQQKNDRIASLESDLSALREQYEEMKDLAWDRTVECDELKGQLAGLVEEMWERGSYPATNAVMWANRIDALLHPVIPTET